MPEFQWLAAAFPNFVRYVVVGFALAGFFLLIYVLITGIGWEYVPPCFPCGKTIKARLDRWLELDAFRAAWQRLAERYQELHGVNWDKVLLDGPKKPAKKGAP